MARQSGEWNRRESFIAGGVSAAIGIGTLALVNLAFHAPLNESTIGFDVFGGVMTLGGGLSVLHGLTVK